MFKDRLKSSLEVVYGACEGDFTKIDPSYLEALDPHLFTEGVEGISTLQDNVDTFDSFEDFWEYAEPLVDGYEGEEIPLEFAEEDSEEEFLKKVISTIYLDGVANVATPDKKRITESNSAYDPNKNEWNVMFQDNQGNEFECKISKSGGKWGISYKMLQK